MFLDLQLNPAPCLSYHCVNIQPTMCLGNNPCKRSQGVHNTKKVFVMKTTPSPFGISEEYHWIFIFKFTANIFAEFLCGKRGKGKENRTKAIFEI